MVKLKKASSLPVEVHDPKAEAEKVSTSVRLSEVFAAGLRLDASTFNVAARNAVAAVKASGLAVVPLYGPGGLSREAHNAFRFRRIYVSPEKGVPFLSSAEIISMRPRADRYISKKLTPNLDELLIEKWDVLISCSGTIGNVGLAGNTFAGKALSQDAIRLRTEDAETAGYTTAFLRSKYGRPQLLGATYGSVIVHIEPEHLTHIVIPDLPPIRRIAIGRLMCQAAELRDKANNLIDEADRLLHERLGLPELQVEDKKGHQSTQVKASKLNWRLEASFHNPSAAKSLRRINRLPVPVLTIGDPSVAKEVRAITKFRKRVYVPHGGILLLNTKQLFQVDPVDVKHLAKGAHTKDLPEIQLAKNMIAVTASGTIGRVQIIPAYMGEWTANQHAHRIIAAQAMNPGYIYAWLASDYGYQQMTRYSYGSVILELDRDMLSAVPIPIPAETIRDEIGNLVLQANELRDEAWRKEQDAIRQAESLIEGVSFDLHTSEGGSSSEILLTNLESGFEVRHPIPVSVQKIDRTFVASFVAANLHASGDTVEEAVSNLKYLLVDSFDLLLTHRPDELGPGPKRQLSVLQSYMGKTGDAQQRTRA
jgi:type I restriction enzyme, S subunit